MSSRKGDVITAEWLIDEIKKAVAEKIEDREFTAEEREAIQEKVAIAAIRYSILRQGIGKDIIFDIEKSIAFQGESGPYLQYTYARLKRVAKKGAELAKIPDCTELKTDHELGLIRKFFQFPDEVRRSTEEVMTNNLTKYLYELANLMNRFYEDEQILVDEHTGRRAARLLLAETAADILARGLKLLGIEVLEAI
jgi:arginyl-tRNA synthetase